jgi:membrane protease YdiL (CAAX protease family)
MRRLPADEVDHAGTPGRNHVKRRLGRRDVLASAGILGVFVAGVFFTWLLIVGWGIPLPKNPIGHKFATTLIQAFAVIALPYAVVHFWLGLTPSILGLNFKNFKASFLWGCALYAIGMIGFVHCSGDPLIARHPVRFLDPGNAILLTLVMSIHAATTDLATRGFILLALDHHSPTWFAIVMQNLVWVYGHVYEIALFTHCLGGPTVPFTNMGLWAVLLFTALGVLGDMVALKTRNVVGLALAHVALNLAMVTYIRFM